MAKAKVSAPVAADDDMDDYKSQDDANTLQKAAEIQQDPDRHSKAAKHLEKRASAAGQAHKQAQKQLHGKVKKGLKKAFGGGGAGNQPGTFGAAKEQEEAQTEKIVNEKDV
jgi:hypothetical protein